MVSQRSQTSQTEGRPARPRSSTLLDDGQRGAFLAEWNLVQTSFVANPQKAAQAAERLVLELADSVVRRIGEITDAVGRPGADTSGSSGTPAEEGAAGTPAPDEETWREHLLRCRNAFSQLIDS